MLPDTRPTRPRPEHRPQGGGILSQHDFYAQYGHRFGAPGSGAYDRYRAYRTNVPKRRAAARAGNAPTGQQAFDPLAILTDAELRQRATAAVNAANAPVLANLKSTYADRSQQEAASIAAATKAYVEAAGQYAPAVGAAYGGAQHDQAASDAALAALLHGGGTQAASELAGQLGTGSPIAAGAGATGTGAAGASLATGTADLTRLLAEGAHAADYGAKLPGIAANTGLQDTRTAMAQLDRELAAALADVSSKQPGQVEDLYQQSLSNRTSVALAKQSGYLDATKAQQDYNYRTASLRERIAHDKAVEANAKATAAEKTAARLDRENAAADARNAKTTASGRPNAALSAKYGYIVDSNGDPVLRNGQRVPVAKTGKTPGGKPAYTPQQRSSAFYSTRDKAFSEAKRLHAKKGTGTLNAGVSRDQAYNQLWNAYAPQLVSQYGYKRQAVQQMLNKALDSAGF